MRILIALIVVLMWPTPGVAADWIFANSYEDRVVYVDGGTMSININGVSRLWLLTEFRAPKEYPPNMVYSYKDLSEFDCRKRLSRNKSATLYDDKGNVIAHIGDLGDPWDDVVPDTVGEDNFDVACGKSSLEKKISPKILDSTWNDLFSANQCWVRYKESARLSDSPVTVLYDLSVSCPEVILDGVGKVDHLYGMVSIKCGELEGRPIDVWFPIRFDQVSGILNGVTVPNQDLIRPALEVLTCRVSKFGPNEK